MIKAKSWNGNDLKGDWQVTAKIDGVRAFRKFGGWVSRNGKMLYNLPQITSPHNDFEVYCSVPGQSSKENYTTTMEKIKAKNQDRPIAPDDLYSLDPIDTRLIIMNVLNPSAFLIRAMLHGALQCGYEGLILRQGDVWLKVKPVETYDVKITGVVEGTGRNKGRLGALITERGKVGTGISDQQREDLWLWHITGHNGICDCPLEEAIVEVECMQLTSKGKFRHPRFSRIRWDK